MRAPAWTAATGAASDVPVRGADASERACWYCAHAVAADDRYCRHCGEGQGTFLAWYYRPLWIGILAVTVLGPLVLPLLWRTPRLDRISKWIASVAVIVLFGWIGWQLVQDVRELANALS
jgi:hypothetical protein